MTLDTIVGCIAGITILLVLVGLGVIASIWAYHTDKRRKEFLSTLNEHELAIISRYFQCALHPFEKEDK